MELLQRYLKAIEFWLPAGEKQDILAEISEDIHSQIEERQTALGRVLRDTEIETLLKLRGRPMLVANRYRPQRWLIGPDWFPTYVFVLKIVGLCYVLPWLVIYFIVQRVNHPASNWGLTLLATWSTAWTVAFIAAATVTLIFSVLQLTEAHTHFLENWNPRQLPVVRDAFKIPRISSIVEIVVGVAFVLWWIAYAYAPEPFNGPAFKLSLNPVWVYFFWGYLTIGLANIALAIFNLRRPSWSVARATCRTLSDLAGGALFCWLLKADIVASIWVANVAPARMMEIKTAIQYWIGQCFPIALIVALIVVVIDVFRIVRVRQRSGVDLANGAAVSAR
jgi:hypothetical protein